MVLNVKIAIILHLHYQDLWPEIKEYIEPILSNNVHLYVTTNSYGEYINDIKNYANKINVVENIGMDFGPFILTYDDIKDSDYDYIVKIHGKKSLHTPNLGYYWRTKLFKSMLETKEKFEKIITYMYDNKNIYMASASEFFYDRNREYLNHPNRLMALNNINRVRRYINVEDHGCFFAGSMFIVSTDYLKKLFNNVDLNVLYSEFEYGYFSDSFAHGMERVIGYGVETYNGKYLGLD